VWQCRSRRSQTPPQCVTAAASFPPPEVLMITSVLSRVGPSCSAARRGWSCDSRHRTGVSASSRHEAGLMGSGRGRRASGPDGLTFDLCWRGSDSLRAAVTPSPSASRTEPITTPLLPLLWRYGQLQDVTLGRSLWALEIALGDETAEGATNGLTTRFSVSRVPQRGSTL
jgi:hypothetical protein